MSERDHILSLRLTGREVALLKAVAKAEGMTPSELLREGLFDRIFSGREGKALPLKIEIEPIRLHDLKAVQP